MTNLPLDDRIDIIIRRMRYDIGSGQLFWLPRPRSDFDYLDQSGAGGAESTYKMWVKQYENQPIRPNVVPPGGCVIRLASEGMAVSAHRAAWLLVTGYWPGPLYPLDDNRFNYRIENWQDADGMTALERGYMVRPTQLEMEPLWQTAGEAVAA